jgi:3-dehydroquinate synthase
MMTLQSNSYLIHFDDSLQELGKFIAESAYSKIFILVDSNTSEHCLPLLNKALPGLIDFDIIEVDPGEENKTIDFCIGIWKMLVDFNADRNSLLINLGGGVITDMGGFAASTFKRGIDFVHVPTTLLSQVDASVGGKTGIDMDQVKNIIGTFTQPKGVFIEPAFLKTMSRRQIFSGFAEIIKHGLIYDKNFFQQLGEIKPEVVPAEIIFRSVEIKNEVVKADPLEKGLRKILNFGHTIGHAVESYSLKNDRDPLLHGEAIAIGFICEGFLSVKYNGLPEAELKTICKTILSRYPKYQFKKSQFSELISLMQMDKKNMGGKINFSLLKTIGECGIDSFCNEEDITRSLEYYLESACPNDATSPSSR